MSHFNNTKLKSSNILGHNVEFIESKTISRQKKNYYTSPITVVFCIIKCLEVKRFVLFVTHLHINTEHYWWGISRGEDKKALIASIFNSICPSSLCLADHLVFEQQSDTVYHTRERFSEHLIYSQEEFKDTYTLSLSSHKLILYLCLQ